MCSREKKQRVFSGIFYDPYREKVCLVCSPEENNSHHCQVSTKYNASSENLSQLPAIR